MGMFSKALGMMGLARKSAPYQVHPYEFRGFDAALEHAMSGSLTVNASTAFGFYRRSSAIATAVDLIASKIEQIDPVIERDGEIHRDDEVIERLARPNDHQLWRPFVGQSVRNYLLTGNAYWIGLGNIKGAPLEVYAASPAEAHPFTSVRDGFPESYSVSSLLAPGTYRKEDRPRGQGGGIWFVDGPLRQLYHVKGYSSRVMGLVGDSPIEAILLETRQHIAGREHNEAMLRNGGRLSLLFVLKKMLNDVQAKMAIESLKKQYSGPENAGRVGAVQAEDMDVREFGITPKDMDYAVLDEMTKATVFSRFHVPLPLVTASRQTLSNYAEAIDALYHDAVIPTLCVILEGLSDFLLPRFGRDPGKERITYDPQSIIALRRRMLEELKQIAALNILTVNEQRAKLPDLEDIESGDAVYGPATLVPIAGDGADLTQDDRDADEETRRQLEEEAAA